jgi:hypothetical protein
MVALIVIISLIGMVVAFFGLRACHCDADACIGGALILGWFALILCLLWRIGDRSEKAAKEVAAKPRLS